MMVILGYTLVMTVTVCELENGHSYAIDLP